MTDNTKDWIEGVVEEINKRMYVVDRQHPANMLFVKQKLVEAFNCGVLASEGAVPEKRGSEEQVQAAQCGLYHWNDCRASTIQNLQALRLKI